MTFRKVLPLLSLALWLSSGGFARADISYSYATDVSSYNISAVGGTVTVQIYLNENLSGGSTSLEIANNGLSGAGFYVNTIAGNGANISAIAGNTATNSTVFGGTSLGNPGDGFNTGGSAPSVSTNNVGSGSSQARLSEAVTATTGTGPIGSSTSFGDHLLLGTLTIKGLTINTTTTFKLQTYRNAPQSIGGSGTDGNTVDNGAFSTGVSNDYDVSGTDAATSQAYTGANNSTFQTFTVTVGAVPEPSSMALCGLAACGGLYGAYRRRKAMAAKVELA
jgi:hypothetical protein